MSRIPHTRRINGRYIFQRRVHLRNLISKPVGLALQTADPDTARHRAALLSARFVTTARTIKAMYSSNGAALTGKEIEAVFQAELRDALERAIDSIYQAGDYDSAMNQTRVFAEAYRVARRANRPDTLTPEDEADLVARGHEDWIEFIRCDLDRLCNARTLEFDDIYERLHSAAARISAAAFKAAEPHILRARAEAFRRAQFLNDPAVLDAPNPVEALLSARFDPPTPGHQPASIVTGPANDAAAAPTTAEYPRLIPSHPDSLFQVYDPQPFSAVIADVLAELKTDGTWKGDLKQQRRIMETFAWITGDKQLGAYTHLDAASFKKGLQRLPAKFYFGSLAEGAMARPFAEVMAEQPPLNADSRRSHKTVNRDLSTMATVAKHLATTSWMPRMQGAIIMNFGAGRIAIKDDPNIDTRPPWTTAHLDHLFRSPLYTGGGGALRRLRDDEPERSVWHDAAYWAPLLWFYHHSCREETCGLEIADIVADHPIPHFHIRDNLTRGRDGETAGEKRRARRRILPIHQELLRLGFLEYVEAIHAEGHRALFPELYVNAEKRGGAHFYERAWQHMVGYIGARIPLPTNAAGKGPDIHSVRALGSSFYEVDGVNELMRADVMGHAREGTNGKHYSKRMATEGLDVVLVERRAFIERYVPTITRDIDPQPIRLLPLEKRSRVGAGIVRKRRSDAGAPRDD